MMSQHLNNDTGTGRVVFDRYHTHNVGPVFSVGILTISIKTRQQIIVNAEVIYLMFICNDTKLSGVCRDHPRSLIRVDPANSLIALFHYKQGTINLFATTTQIEWTSSYISVVESVKILLRQNNFIEI